MDAKRRRKPQLSPRERQVLVLICRGATNNEIAHELGLTHETVKTYCNRLRAKLGFKGTRVGRPRRDEYAKWLLKFPEETFNGMDNAKN